MKLFENSDGMAVDFEKDVITADPDRTNGSLFKRTDREDFWFKINVILNYFNINEGVVLRHAHFLKLVKDTHDQEERAREKKKEVEVALAADEIKIAVIERLENDYTFVKK